ncbi:MAG: hypothetical protein ABIA93_01845 [Candidatus Woesearchaeota archaeon]
MRYVRVDHNDVPLMLSQQEIESFSGRLDVKGFTSVEMQDGTVLYLSPIEYENANKRAEAQAGSISQSSYIANEQATMDIQQWNKTIVFVAALLAGGVMLLFVSGRGITGMATTAAPVQSGAGWVLGICIAVGLVALIFTHVKKKFL